MLNDILNDILNNKKIKIMLNLDNYLLEFNQ